MPIQSDKRDVTFHHFGLAVKSFTEALCFYESLGYHCASPVIDPLQGVEAIFCTSPDSPSVEIIKPTNEKSPINNYLSKCNELIYHTCYEIQSGHSVEDVFPDNRAICISKPKPAVMFDNQLISFYYIKNVGLIELLQKPSPQ